MNQPRGSLTWERFSNGDPPLAGYTRSYWKCRKCSSIYINDYIPYSLSNPVIWTPCGHSVGFRDYNCDTLTEDEVRKILQPKGSSSMAAHTIWEEVQAAVNEGRKKIQEVMSAAQVHAKKQQELEQQADARAEQLVREAVKNIPAAMLDARKTVVVVSIRELDDFASAIGARVKYHITRNNLEWKEASGVDGLGTASTEIYLVIPL